MQNDFFSKFSQIFYIPKQAKNVQTAWLAYPILINNDVNFKRKDFQIYLEKRDIQTRVVFTGNILRQPGFKDIACKGNPEDFIVADEVMRGGILLGCHHGLTEDLMGHIHSSAADFLDSY